MHKGSLTNKILFALEKSVDGYLRLENFAYHHYRYKYGIPDLPKSRLSEAIKRLREKGYVDLVEANEQFVMRITPLGEEALGVRSVEEWDGKWRIIIFDVPEEHRIIRDLFRRKLKMWDFEIWQKSVWATKRNVTVQLVDLIRNLKMGEWVKVIESSKVI